MRRDDPLKTGVKLIHLVYQWAMRLLKQPADSRSGCLAALITGRAGGMKVAGHEPEPHFNTDDKLMARRASPSGSLVVSG
jgi:hypothetical protein